MTFIERIFEAPTLSAISLSEAKAHLRITEAETADDDYITSLITVATNLVEQHTNRALLTQTWDLWVDRAPQLLGHRWWIGGYRGIPLPRGPVASVALVESLDEDNTAMTIDPSEYLVDLFSEPARVRLKSSVNAHRIHVRYTAGETSAAKIPAPIKQAILLQLADLYDNRSNEVVGVTNSITLTSSGVEALLRNYRLFPLGLS